MPPLSSRMTKNRAQPARYRPGKAEAEDLASEEESSEEEEEDDRPAPAKAPPPKATSFPSQKKLAVDLSKAGQQISAAPKVQAKQPDEDLEGFVTASESSDDEDGSGESGSGSEEEDSSDEEESSDDEPKRPMLAPKFISKAKRAQQATAEPSAEAKAAEEEKLRQEKADALLQAELERKAAARAAGNQEWDADVPEEEIDDTDYPDGEDPVLQKRLWVKRELKRQNRERQDMEEHEKEKEEIERRRNLTVEEREEEDRKFLEAQNEAREGKGQMGYMQKYFHKGAFFNNAGEEDEEVKAVLNRDLAGARFEDDADKNVLPEYMKIRDMTKLGKKGRTKYKDLKNEDTGQWGRDVGRKKREFDGSLDDRFRPDDDRGRGPEQTGANSAPVGERRKREDGDRYREEKRARYD